MKRYVIGLAALAGLAAIASKALATKKQAWQGLTEAELRQRLGERIPSRVPDVRRSMITERVVEKMRNQGMIRVESEETSAAATDAEDPSADPADPAEGVSERE